MNIRTYCRRLMVSPCFALALRYFESMASLSSAAPASTSVMILSHSIFSARAPSSVLTGRLHVPATPHVCLQSTLFGQW